MYSLKSTLAQVGNKTNATKIRVVVVTQTDCEKFEKQSHIFSISLMRLFSSRLQPSDCVVFQRFNMH